MKDDLHIRYFISIVLAVLGVGLAWLGTVTSQVLMWIGIGIVAVAVILSWTIRCPHCGHGLAGKRQLFLPNYCPHCGEKL